MLGLVDERLHVRVGLLVAHFQMEAARQNPGRWREGEVKMQSSREKDGGRSKRRSETLTDQHRD